MRIITSTGEELTFPTLRIFGIVAVSWIAGIACGWGWFGTKDGMFTAQAFVFGVLIGMIALAGLIVFTDKK